MRSFIGSTTIKRNFSIKLFCFYDFMLRNFFFITCAKKVTRFCIDFSAESSRFQYPCRKLPPSALKSIRRLVTSSALVMKKCMLHSYCKRQLSVLVLQCTIIRVNRTIQIGTRRGTSCTNIAPSYTQIN